MRIPTRTSVIAPLVLGTLFFYAIPARAYDNNTTHPALTDEAVDFYNSTAPADGKLTAEEKEWIIEGSILEDTAPRWINHFYDPVNKTGWTGEKAGTVPPEAAQTVAAAGIMVPAPLSAVEWADAFLVQQEYSRYGGDRTWKRAIEYYAEGNEKEAYVTLGYTLHLLEDMSVPDHTRDDTHAQVVSQLTGDEGSPYEEYAVRWTWTTIKELKITDTLAKESAAPPARSAIGDYLIAVAEYSNRYFFSKDTINDPKYQFPKIVREDDDFGYNLDENGKEFPLVTVDLKNTTGNVKAKEYSLKNREEFKPILDAYFSRLARQTVLNGAGAIKLFKSKAEDAVVNKEFVLTKPNREIISLFTPSSFSLVGEGEKIVKATGGFFGVIADAARASLAVVGQLTSGLLSTAKPSAKPTSKTGAIAPVEQSSEQPAEHIAPTMAVETTAKSSGNGNGEEAVEVDGSDAGDILKLQLQVAELIALRDELRRELATQAAPLQQQTNAAPSSRALLSESAQSGVGGSDFRQGGGGGGEFAPTGGVSVVLFYASNPTSATETGSSASSSASSTASTASSTSSSASSTSSTASSTSSEASSTSNTSSTASSTSSNASSTTSSTTSATAYPTIANFHAVYNTAPRIDFSWEPSQDENGVTSTNAYVLYDVTNPSSTVLIVASSSALSYSRTIDEVGRTYSFEFRVTDASGTTRSTTTVVTAPSFFDAVFFYRDTRAATADRYVVDVTTSSTRPFWDPTDAGDMQSWKFAVFYLNHAAPKQASILTAQQLQPADTNLLRLYYRSCHGGTGPQYSLILPSNQYSCQGGGLISGAYSWFLLEDRRLFVNTADTAADVTYSPSDYVTVAFYDFDHGGGGEQVFSLAAVDVTPHYFQNSPSASAPPTAPVNVTTTFNAFSLTLTASWPGSTDLDTRDALVAYRFNATTSGVLADAAWQSVGTGLSKTIDVVYLNTYTLGVRAVDDFGNTSAVATTTWSFPAGYAPLPVQSTRDTPIDWGGSGAGQRILMYATSTINGAAMWMWNAGGPYCCARTYLELRADTAGSIGAVIATSAPVDVSDTNVGEEAVYDFSSPVELSANTYYWLVPRKGPGGTNDSRVYGTDNPALYPDGFWSSNPSVDAYFRLRKP
jgi:hypothetical protein